MNAPQLPPPPRLTDCPGLQRRHPVLELLAAVVAPVASLAYWPDRKFAQIEDRFKLVEGRLAQA